MGYRLHYAKKYTVEYDGGSFNWQSDQFSNLVADHMPESYANEDREEVELNPKELQAYIDTLAALPQDQPSRYFSEYTVGKEREALQEVLDGYDKSNDYIYLTWF